MRRAKSNFTNDEKLQIYAFKSKINILKLCIQGECVEHGSIQSHDGNACEPNPCLNDGVCKQLGTYGYLCGCRSNQTGYNCQSKAENIIIDSIPLNYNFSTVINHDFSLILLGFFIFVSALYF